MKRVLLFIFYILLSNHSIAQLETNIWYFGSKAGLKFDGIFPTTLSDGHMNQLEACATICDNKGGLLFYTNGIRIWNRKHHYMSNGMELKGTYTSTQCLIVPKPGEHGLYYIFTTDYEGQPEGFRYSVVNMELDSGLGGVVEKNILLLTPSTEKVTAVKHWNGHDIWVITHGWDSNNFYSYLLTDSGLTTTPIVSSIGSTHTGNQEYAIGQLKSSPDGSKLACSIAFLSLVELFSFDNYSGKVNKQIFSQKYGNSYGVEFSNDASKLYATEEKRIYQYNLHAGNYADIKNSATLIGSNSLEQFGSLQLGPDGRIYAAISNTSLLGVIDEPNLVGTKSNFIQSGVILSNGAECFYGLPNYVSSYFYQSPIKIQNTCLGNVTKLSINKPKDIKNVIWNFGDSLSSENSSTKYVCYHLYGTPGVYKVKVIREFDNNFKDTLSIPVSITPYQRRYFPRDTTFCVGEVVTLDARSANASYLWQNGSQNQEIPITQGGLYWVEVRGKECSYIDSINVHFYGV